jgi:K+-sensing histidine kinase KdpD
MLRFDRLYFDFSVIPPGSVRAYFCATAIVIAMTALRYEFGSHLAGAQFITLFPAVLVSTFFFAARAGAYCVILSTVCAWYFLLPPVLSVAPDSNQLPPLIFFVLVASTDVVLIAAMRAARADLATQIRSLIPAVSLPDA